MTEMVTVNKVEFKTSSLIQKGALYILGAQAVFFGSGFIINFGITRMITPSEYGLFGVIMSLLGIFQIFFNRGIPDATSKYIGMGKDVIEIKRKAIRLQLLLSFGVYVIILVFAPFLSSLLNEEDLTGYIRFGALLIPIRAIYNIYLASFNGQMEFGKTSVLVIISSIAKIFSVFIFLYIGYELYGIIGGYLLSAVVGLVIAYTLSGSSKVSNESVSYRELFSFSFFILIFTLCYILLMELDLLFVKSLVPNQDHVGYYNSVKVLSSLALGAVTGLSVVVMPLVSKSFSEKLEHQTEYYIHFSLKCLLIILIPFGVLFSIESNFILSTLFPDEYAYASKELIYLVWATIFISTAGLFGTITNAIGQPKISMIFGLCLVAVDIPLNYYLIKSQGIFGGALSTFIVGALGLFLFTTYIFKELNITIPKKTLFNIFMAGASQAFILLFFIEPYANFLSEVIIIFFSLLIYTFILFWRKEVSYSG